MLSKIPQSSPVGQQFPLHVLALAGEISPGPHLPRREGV